jgi:hypothetical protein
MSEKQGEYVAIEFSSTDATTAAAVTLKDGNGATRTLAADERVLIDSLTGMAVQDDTDPSTDILVTLIGDYDAGADIDAGERIWAFAGGSVFDGGDEGFSMKTGFTPKVKASGAGQVSINGVGRIQKGDSLAGITRPSFEAKLWGR